MAHSQGAVMHGNRQLGVWHNQQRITAPPARIPRMPSLLTLASGTAALLA